MIRRTDRTGITFLELLIVVVAVVIGAILLLPLLGRARSATLPMRDSTRIRGTHQSMAIWAGYNNGSFPLPSAVDIADTTVAQAGAAKDTTANILSLLIYTGGISVELPISLAESNTASIAQDDDYLYDMPVAALDPANALWDPAFAADFTNGGVGNVSYAHVLPGGGRGALWRSTSTTTQPVIGNRGPEVTSMNAAGTPTFALATSKTFLIHGANTSWEGNIGYNDGHVALETRTNPAGLTYQNAAKKKLPDNLFFDEPDDATGHNAWMSIWTTAGDTKGDFTPIWD